MTGKLPLPPGLKEALKLSKAEAIRLGSNLIEPDHHILGILRKGDGLAIQTLQYLNVDLKRLREFILARLGRGSGPVTDSITPSEASIHLLESASSIEKSLRHGCLGTQHLLIALVESQHSSLSQFLNESGITSAMVREAVNQVVADQSEDFKQRAELDEKKRDWSDDPWMRLNQTLWQQFSIEAREELSKRYANETELFEYLKYNVSSWEFAAAMGKAFRVPFITLSNCEIEPHVVQAIPADYVRANRIVPVDLTNNVLTVAVDDPAGMSKQAELERITKRQVAPVISFSEQIDEVIARYYPPQN